MNGRRQGAIAGRGAVSRECGQRGRVADAPEERGLRPPMRVGLIDRAPTATHPRRLRDAGPATRGTGSAPGRSARLTRGDRPERNSALASHESGVVASAVEMAGRGRRQLLHEEGPRTPRRELPEGDSGRAPERLQSREMEPPGKATDREPVSGSRGTKGGDFALRRRRRQSTERPRATLPGDRETRGPVSVPRAFAHGGACAGPYTLPTGAISSAG